VKSKLNWRLNRTNNLCKWLHNKAKKQQSTDQFSFSAVKWIMISLVSANQSQELQRIDPLPEHCTAFWQDFWFFLVQKLYSHIIQYRRQRCQHLNLNSRQDISLFSFFSGFLVFSVQWLQCSALFTLNFWLIDWLIRTFFQTYPFASQLTGPPGCNKATRWSNLI